MPLIDAGFHKSDGSSDGPPLLQYGPTINVVVSSILSPKSSASSVSDVKMENVHALIDTGASNCMIDSMLAKSLELIPVDRALVAGVHGKTEHLIYMAAILVPQLDIHQFGRFLSANLKNGGHEHQVLLGRDFLANTIMIYDGTRSQITLASAAMKKA